MVGHAGSATGIVHADMTLAQSKVKVTGLLNFRKLARLCMLTAMTVSPHCGAFWFKYYSTYACTVLCYGRRME